MVTCQRPQLGVDVMCNPLHISAAFDLVCPLNEEAGSFQVSMQFGVQTTNLDSAVEKLPLRYVLN